MSVDATPDPLPTRAFVAGVVALVAAGGVWWVAAAPPSPPPVAVDRVPPAVVAGPERGQPPAVEELVPEERGLLPAAPGVLVESQESLGDGDTVVVWDAAVDGETYVLRHTCVGDGGLVEVAFEGMRAGEPTVFTCAGELGEVMFVGSDSGFVSVRRRGGEALVAVQVAVAG